MERIVTIYDVDKKTGNIHYSQWYESDARELNIQEEVIYDSKMLSSIAKINSKYPIEQNMNTSCCDLKKIISESFPERTRRIPARRVIYRGYYCLRIYFDDSTIDITPYRLSVKDGKPKVELGHTKWQIVARDVLYDNRNNVPQLINCDTKICVQGTNESYFPKLNCSDSCEEDESKNIAEAIKRFLKEEQKCRN